MCAPEVQWLAVPRVLCKEIIWVVRNYLSWQKLFGLLFEFQKIRILNVLTEIYRWQNDCPTWMESEHPNQLMLEASFPLSITIYKGAIISKTLTLSTCITTFSQKLFDFIFRLPKRKIIFTGLVSAAMMLCKTWWPGNFSYWWTFLTSFCHPFSSVRGFSSILKMFLIT